MIDVVHISLENEMDLVLAHRRSMRVAEKLGLTVATQTTFATAVSEIARTVIEHTNNGNLVLGIDQLKTRYGLKAIFNFESSINLTASDEGFYYAQKLVPEFEMTDSNGTTLIEMKIGIPRSSNLDPLKISELKKFFANEPPINAYEEIKKRNLSLNKITEEQEEELRRSKIIDEKKTEFISVASHEIKTPITIIKAYSQMLKTGKDQDPGRIKTIVDKIDIQSSKLLSLVQQLLDVAKTESGNLVYSMESIEFNPFITDMVAVMKHILPQHELRVNLCSNVKVNMDKLRMEQVFSNLLGNAAKYSSKNSAITIHCETIGSSLIQVCVIDQGIGMSEKSMQSIFEKFYRDKDVIRSHSGLGMGLYITSKIISDHGGKIWVESTEAVGSKFFFTLPCEDAAMSA